MPNIKLNITDISDLKVGSTQINYVYLATTLLWQKITRSNDITSFYTTVTFNSLTSEQSKYSTTVNLKL